MAVCKSVGMVFRGMSIDFYEEQDGYLSAKCNECNTTIKYHVREGNHANRCL